MEVTCSFASFAPYAFVFAGVGFLCATICIVLMSHSDKALDRFLTAGFLARWKQAGQQARRPASQQASEQSQPAGKPVRDPNWQK
jgi:hypothetical protein